MRGLRYIYIHIYPAQCVVLCYEDNKEYTCKTTSLSTEARDYVSKSDLTPGNELMWKHKGKNYTVEFKRFKGTAEPSSTSRPQYPEDSESPACTSEEEDEKDVKGKGKRKGPKKSQLKRQASLYPQNDENDEEVVSVVSKKRLEENEQIDFGRLQGSGLAAGVGGTAPLSGAGAQIVDAISQSSHVDGLGTCSVSAIGAEGGIELLKIESADIVKYGLALLDALFTDEEQATHCYKVSGKSNSSSVSAKPPMSPGRVKTLEECIEKKYGAGAMAASKDKIRISLNQKCRDKKHRKLADQLKSMAMGKIMGKNMAMAKIMPLTWSYSPRGIFSIDVVRVRKERNCLCCSEGKQFEALASTTRNSPVVALQWIAEQLVQRVEEPAVESFLDSCRV
eukprot:Em0017g888a